MDSEFLNAYVQRLLALNSELTNKTVMLETRLLLLDNKYNTLFAQHQEMLSKLQQIQEEEAQALALQEQITESLDGGSDDDVVEEDPKVAKK